MDDDLRSLGEDLVTTSARIIRWVPKTDDFGISVAAVRLLARLQDAGPTRISDLARAERSSQPTITNHVKRLEGLGYIERRTDPGDARAWIISLSELGRHQLRYLRHSLASTIAPYLAEMSVADQEALRQGVAAMQRLMAQPQPTPDR